MLARVTLWFADAEKQLSEALRLWKAREVRGALYWGRRAARHSDLAKVVVAQWLMDDPTAAREAVELLEQGAAAGSTEAQQVLAAWYLNGTRVPKDPVKAYELTKRAADAGSLTCQIAMVRFLTSGEYREPDIDAAMHYAERAAEAGHSDLLAALVQAKRSLPIRWE